jgi:hypothetical protein
MSDPKLAIAVKGKGRHYQLPDGGDPVPSVTNVIGTVLNKPALPRWAAKVVAEQAVAMKDSLAKLDDAEAIDLLKGAPWRSSTRAAGRGTTVHEVIEAKLGGLDVPTDIGAAAPWLRSVDRFLDEHDVVAEYRELTMFGDGYAGTCDFVGTIDGVPVYADWKTGKDLYPEVALQLSALAHCDLWATDAGIVPADDDRGDRELLAVLFTETTYRIAKVDDCFPAFRALLDVWRWHAGPSPIGTWSGHTSVGREGTDRGGASNAPALPEHSTTSGEA